MNIRVDKAVNIGYTAIPLLCFSHEKVSNPLLRGGLFSGKKNKETALSLAKKYKCEYKK